MPTDIQWSQHYVELQPSTHKQSMVHLKVKKFQQTVSARTLNNIAVFRRLSVHSHSRSPTKHKEGWVHINTCNAYMYIYMYMYMYNNTTRYHGNQTVHIPPLVLTACFKYNDGSCN